MHQTAPEWVEEAVQLLRSAGLGTWLAYYLGTIPCMVAILYFLADMSRGALAHTYMAEAACAVALAYLWMKCWQTVFCSHLMAVCLRIPHERWTFSSVLRMVSVQVAIQPIGLFLRFIAANLIFPYIWVYGAIQLAGVCGDGREGFGVRKTMGEAFSVGKMWLFTTHASLVMVLCFGVMVGLNFIVLLMVFPHLLKMFFGLETVFTASPESMFNSTLLTAVAALTYLTFDPVRKALFVVKYFYASARTTGDDLRVQLRAAVEERKRTATAASMALAVVLCFSWPSLAQAEVTPDPSGLPPLEQIESPNLLPIPDTGEVATALNDSITRVLKGREYIWRLPPGKREKEETAEDNGWISVYLRDLSNSIKEGFKAAKRWYDAVRNWWDSLFPNKKTDEPEPPSGSWLDSLRFLGSPQLIIVLLTVSLAVLLFFLYRVVRKRAIRVVPPVVAAAAPDLEREDVVADELPEDGWLRLARELIEKGEYRLALRSLYLSALANLGERRLLTITRYKSNREYHRELRRKAAHNPTLVHVFGETLNAFERSWYGTVDTSLESVLAIQQELERIRA